MAASNVRVMGVCVCLSTSYFHGTGRESGQEAGLGSISLGGLTPGRLQFLKVSQNTNTVLPA